MARRREIKIEGAKELDAALKALPTNVAKRALIPSLRSGANVFRREVVTKAPDDPDAPHPKYGELKKNITSTLEKRGEGWAVIVHTGRAFWARFLEFGTIARRPRAKQVMKGGDQFFGKEVAPMPAQPFFRPAWDNKAMETLQRIGQRLGENINKEAERLARGPRRRRRR
jgi:HK97 gp10 family phage protein